MFTGLVSAVGKIVNYDGRHLAVRSPYRQIRLGESISVNGVCLTVTRKAGAVLSFDVGPATRKVTTFGRLKSGDSVNLERALRVGDRVGGHWVSGHVEKTGRIQRVERAGRSRWLYVALPKRISRYVVPKGSLTVDGVSLTVAELKRNNAKNMLIPHTLRFTTQGTKQEGDAVNI
jgi:riboflavin synthase